MDVYDLSLHKYLDHIAIKRLEKKKERYHEIVPTRLSILEKIVDALIFLHDKKIWHLDLKPLNIMMNSEKKTDGKRGDLWDGQTLKLIDFGISMLDGCFEKDIRNAFKFLIVLSALYSLTEISSMTNARFLRASF